MAKFRQHHQRGRSSHSLFSPRTIFLVVLLIGLGIWTILGGGFDMERMFGGNSSDDYFSETNSSPQGPGKMELQDNFLPIGADGPVIKHSFYALSYNEQHEQADWVAYELTKASIQAPNVKRSGDFRRDRKIRSTSAEREDYKRSGYDRGHMVPAGDMAFSEQAMSETFLMSNMSPQVRAFNGGIWRELEENVRDWAYEDNHIYVITGPILSQSKLGTIGRNEVTIPSAYFKVLLDIKDPQQKGIGFIMPNEVTDRPIEDFAVSIDEVEEKTGFDFFANLLPEEQENKLEGSFNAKYWPTNKDKFRSRVESWNHR